MNPIYKFAITANGTTRQVFPIYGDGLTKDFEKESGQEFFRAKLSGDLTFESADYDFIVAQAFDEQFVLEIAISYDAGVTLIPYWRGTFWKTDCKFDEDAKKVKVKPSVLDQYNGVLAGLDKEYNLIDLAPEITSVKADKRPMVQVYVPGQSVIGCFLSGMWWEQEAEPTTDETRLRDYFRFTLNKSLAIGEVSGNASIPTLFTKSVTGGKFNLAQQGEQDFVEESHTLRYYFSAGSGGYTQRMQIIRNSDSVVMWEYSISGSGTPQTSLPWSVTLSPISGTGATGDLSVYLHEIPVYSRFVCDTETVNNVQTFPIPTDDIVENNRNYSRVVGYYFPDTIFFSSQLSSTPTQWGLYQPGQYYLPPYVYYNPEFFPVARNAWGRISVWFSFSVFDWIVEQSGRKEFEIRNAYPLASVISVLLNEIAPGVTHEANAEYSQFLYGGTNIVGINQTLLITPKSNIVTAGYDQPAQKATITLRNVTDMLRDCFRCYWFIDEQNRFRVEHIQYFRNGGSYSGTPVVGVDLTSESVPRTGKKWAYARNQYEYEKPAMAARYQFGWMDNVTQLFAGYPINIISRYVNPENIEQIIVAQFTSDIDFVLLNPETISKDGFILLSAIDMQAYSQLQFFQGGVGITIGEKYESLVDTSGTRVHTGLMNITSQNLVVKNPSGYRFGLRFFDENENLLEYTTMWADSQRTVPVPSGSVYVVLLVRNEPETAITPAVVNGLNGSISGIEYTLPYYNFQIDGNDHILQNAYVAFCFLQRYYAYDMPAPDYEINGEQYTAIGIKRLKTQSIRFPALTDPDLLELIETNLGNGTIEKLSVNLSSRNANATLKYDTE